MENEKLNADFEAKRIEMEAKREANKKEMEAKRAEMEAKREADKKEMEAKRAEMEAEFKAKQIADLEARIQELKK
jgi:colicin import membrane protein